MLLSSIPKGGFMRKRNLSLVAFTLFGSLLIGGCSLTAGPKSPSGYDTYTVYRRGGGQLSYWEWIEIGRPTGQNRKNENKEKRTIVSKYFDKDGHFIIVLSDGTRIDAGILNCGQASC